MADKTTDLTVIEIDLIKAVSQFAEQSRTQLTAQNNTALILLFWQIGSRINQTIIQNKRAGYEKQIVNKLAAHLESKYGKNFEEKNLRKMLQFADQFTNKEIIMKLSLQLSWPHFLAVLPIKNPEAKLFYANNMSDLLMSVRNLQKQIALKTFERAKTDNM